MKPNWQPVFKTKASVLFQWYVFEGHKEKYYISSLNLDFGMKNQRIISGEIFIDQNEFDELEIVLSEKIENDYNYLNNFIKLCYQYGDDLVETSRSFTNLENLSNEELLENYLKYQESVLKMMPLLNTVLVIDKVVKNTISSLLVNKLGIKIEKEQELLLSRLIIPQKENFYVKETKSLLNMALKVQEDGKVNIDKEIDDYLREFDWIHCVAYVGRPQTRKDVLRKIKEIVKEDPKGKMIASKKAEGEKLIKYRKSYEKIKKNKELVELLKYAQELIYLETYRIYIFFQAHHIASPLFNEIGKRLDMSKEKVAYLKGDEIIGFLKSNKKVKKDEILKRYKDYSLILEDDLLSLFTGDELKKEKGKILEIPEITGNIANVGRTRGRIKIVHNLEDIEKVNRGDIIVAHKTRPDFTIALIKASGIITDAGGMLSHAAIISREYGIPCIVGTKSATKVFKDGDLVELNAYEGVARKIK